MILNMGIYKAFILGPDHWLRPLTSVVEDQSLSLYLTDIGSVKQGMKLCISWCSQILPRILSQQISELFERLFYSVTSLLLPP